MCWSFNLVSSDIYSFALKVAFLSVVLGQGLPVFDFLGLGLDFNTETVSSLNILNEEVWRLVSMASVPDTNVGSIVF